MFLPWISRPFKMLERLRRSSSATMVVEEVKVLIFFNWKETFVCSSLEILCNNNFHFPGEGWYLNRVLIDDPIYGATQFLFNSWIGKKYGLEREIQTLDEEKIHLLGRIPNHCWCSKISFIRLVFEGRNLAAQEGNSFLFSRSLLQTMAWLISIWRFVGRQNLHVGHRYLALCKSHLWITKLLYTRVIPLANIYVPECPFRASMTTNPVWNNALFTLYNR